MRSTLWSGQRWRSSPQARPGPVPAGPAHRRPRRNLAGAGVAVAAVRRVRGDRLGPVRLGLRAAGLPPGQPRRPLRLAHQPTAPRRRRCRPDHPRTGVRHRHLRRLADPRPAGAAVATIGIFAPSFVFVALLGRIVPWRRARPTARAFLAGLTAASLGLMAGVLSSSPTAPSPTPSPSPSRSRPSSARRSAQRGSSAAASRSGSPTPSSPDLPPARLRPGGRPVGDAVAYCATKHSGRTWGTCPARQARSARWQCRRRGGSRRACLDDLPRIYPCLIRQRLICLSSNCSSPRTTAPRRTSRHDPPRRADPALRPWPALTRVVDTVVHDGRISSPTRRPRRNQRDRSSPQEALRARRRMRP